MSGSSLTFTNPIRYTSFEKITIEPAQNGYLVEVNDPTLTPPRRLVLCNSYKQVVSVLKELNNGVVIWGINDLRHAPGKYMLNRQDLERALKEKRARVDAEEAAAKAKGEQQ